MKKKKILTMISSVVMAAALGATALAGCNNGGGHVHAYNWTVDYEATCSSTGHRTGVCVCGNSTISEVIPINPDAHDYNDWEINEYPTESKEGRATRTCKLDTTASHSHTVETSLPVITAAGTGYVSSEVIQKPTIIAAGKRHFVYSHASGAVEFDIELPKRTSVENVEDAVILGSSLHDMIRTSNGRYTDGDPQDPKYDKDSDKYDPNAVLHSNDFSNYYGNNYVRVHDDGTNRDFWYSRDEKGNPFAISAVLDKNVIINPPEDPENPPEGWEPIFADIPRDPRIDESVTEQNLLGYGYASGGGMRATYGAEDTLLCYYNASQSENAIKYEDKFVKTSTGEYECSFEFSRKEDIHFCRYTVEFTLYPSGAIKNLSVKTKIIRAFMLANSFNGTNTGELIFDSDGDVIFGEIYPIDETTGADLFEVEYEKDENGDLKYEYTYLTDEDGKFILDENGNKIIATDEDGNQIKHPIIKSILVSGIKLKPDGTPLLDRFGNEIARPIPQGWKEGDLRQYYYEKGDKKNDGTGDVYDEDHPYIATRYVEYSQTLKVEGEEVEENPYPPESVYIKSFDVSLEGNTIAEGETVEIEANKSVWFNISNVQPSDTAKLDFDPLRVYLRTNTGDIELSYTGDVDFNQNAYHIVGYFNQTRKAVFFSAQYAGEVTVVLKTLSGKCEREIKLNIKKGSPTALKSYVYTYSDANGTESHIWTEYNDTVTLYVGQPLYVRATAIAEEANYVDDSFVASVSNTYKAYFKIENNLEGVDNSGKKITVSKITPLMPTTSANGVRVYLDSIIMDGTNPVASTDVRVKVVEAPTVDGMFSGEYTGRFNYIKVVENSTLLKPADVKVTVNPDASDSTKGTFTVKVIDGTAEFTSVYKYSYNAETHALTSEYVSGRQDETFRFTFALNEVYKLSITHTTYPGRSETIVLSRRS